MDRCSASHVGSAWHRPLLTHLLSRRAREHAAVGTWQESLLKGQRWAQRTSCHLQKWFPPLGLLSGVVISAAAPGITGSSHLSILYCPELGKELHPTFSQQKMSYWPMNFWWKSNIYLFIPVAFFFFILNMELPFKVTTEKLASWRCY